MNSSNEIERVTISLPHHIASRAEALRTDLNLSRSELYRTAVEHFINEQYNLHLAAVVSEMSEEYRNNKELTSLTALDGEDFA